MTRDKKTVERTKTAIIIFLSISFLFLAYQTGLFSNLFVSTPLFGLVFNKNEADGNGLGNEEFSVGAYSAAPPFCIAVTWEDGSRYAEKFDYESVQLLFDRFSPLLGEALGSSTEPEAVPADEWETALCAGGVYFDYLYYQPLASIATWMGTIISSRASEHSARRILLSTSGDDVLLYFISGKDNVFYRCSTKLDARAFSSRVSDLAPSGARYVFEYTESYPELDRYSLLTGYEGAPSIPVGQNPFRFGLSPKDILHAFGMNSYVARSLNEPDGSVVFIEGGRTLRIKADGLVVFHQTATWTKTSAEEASLTDMVDSAYSLAYNSAGTYANEANIYLSHTSYNSKTGIFSAKFDYVFDGIPVRTLTNGAITIEMTDGRIINAQVYFREYEHTGNRISILPEIQAFAAAGTKGGGEPIIVYEDFDSEVLPSWIINKDG